AIGDPVERLHAILHRALVELEPTVIVRLMAAIEDPLVADALANATRARLALLNRTFAALGFDEHAAATRALTAYGVYLGIAQLKRADPDLLRDPAAAAAYLADL